MPPPSSTLDADELDLNPSSSQALEEKKRTDAESRTSEDHGYPPPILDLDDPEANELEKHFALPSNARRNFLLAVFCAAQFLDTFGATAVVVALPQMAQDLGMTVSESNWIVNAYSLSLASALLTGGRVSDITNPKIVFIVGFLLLGLFSMGVGLAREKTTLLILRAISGLGASLTIPAATTLIIHLFPEPKEQATAIAIFGASGAVASIFGLIIGGALLLGGWSWIFYFSTIIATPLAIACVFLIPDPKTIRHVEPPVALVDGVEVPAARGPRMDYLGTCLQTAAIVLLIFGLTQANVKGWRDPTTISTVVLGALLFPCFFYWQSRINPIDALLSPSLWKIPNFTLLIIFALSMGYWYFTTQVSFSDIFQAEWGITGIMTAVRFLPAGICSTLAVVIAQAIPLTKFPLRWRLISGVLLGAGSSVLFSFVDDAKDFWPLIFPGLVVGSLSVALAYVSAFVSLLMSVPPKHAGVAGGIWVSVLQLGTAALLSLTSTIQVAFPEEEGVPAPSQKGYKFGFIFCMGIMILDAVLVFLFFENPLALVASTSTNEDAPLDLSIPAEEGKSRDESIIFGS
ncbi:major facilitator superfamily domain-containing protein [Mrakia frigida]|uniref:MFS transporter n=1 Tax=Mrakia frigida TaxID=29902 RepID=UPI003FCC024A